jgi:hypothetical protein
MKAEQFVRHIFDRRSNLQTQGKVVKVDKLASHFQRDKYGDFWLTDAIRPSLDLQVIPQEGYRLGTYENERHCLSVPVLVASASRQRLFELFVDLLEPLAGIVDVVLETSHHKAARRHRDIFREHIDKPVLISHFCDFEDLLTHDGCTGVAVVDPEKPIEVQFDEHKLLMVYARDLQPFAAIVRAAGLRRKDHMQLITDGVHLHNTDARHLPAFQDLCYRLGVGEATESVSG